MMYKSFLFAVLAASSLALDHHQHGADRRQLTSNPTGTSSIDYSKVSSQLDGLLGKLSLTAIVASPTVTLGISIPSELRHAIMTAVPASILVKLMNTEYRASVASDFGAGNTPTWYATLDPTLKSFFEGMAKEIKTGSAVYTVTPTASSTTGGVSALATTTKSGLAAAPTGIGREMVASVIAVAGALGVALAL